MAALLFLPVLALASRGLAALEAIAGLLALGLVLRGRIAAGRDLAAWAAPFAALVLWGAVSAAWSLDPARSLLMAARLLGLFTAGLALLACIPALANPERLLRCFFAGLVLGIALLVVQRTTGGLLTRPFSVRGFVAPQLNQASDTLAVLVLPASASLWLRRRRGAAGLLLAAMAATVFGLVGTAAQACLLAGFAAALLFYGLHRRRAALASLAALASILLVVTAPLTFAKFAQIGPLLHAADQFKSSVPHRLLIWFFVGERIAEKPLLGWGLDTARMIPGGSEWIRPGQPWLPLHPHNVPLQLWLELGVPGAVLLALIAARLWLALGRWRAPRLFAAAGAGGLAAALGETLGTYGMWEAWWIGTLWFSLFLVLVMARAVAALPQKRSQARAAST
jgi:exopolysaccharide production protein ExoQ